MKFRFLLLGLLLFAFPQYLISQDFPEPQSPPQMVNDFAGMLNESERSTLETKLRNYRDSTSTEIAIVTLQSMGNYDISSYAFELGERWGIGQEENDNGVLILVALDERQMFIATGYGTEASIPDVYAYRIVDRTLKPNFRNEEYFEGFDEATGIIMSLLSGQYVAEPEDSPGGLGFATFFIILALIVFVIIILIFVGGGGKGGGGYNQGRTFGNPYRRGSTWIDFSSGGGSFGGGGGSFGGFGGGSFGGGGAGGSW